MKHLQWFQFTYFVIVLTLLAVVLGTKLINGSEIVFTDILLCLLAALPGAVFETFVILRYLRRKRTVSEEKTEYMEMTVCPSCQKEIPTFMAYCRYCGAKNPNYFFYKSSERILAEYKSKGIGAKCPECKNETIQGDDYCFVCGKKLDNN